jgi:glyoxylase-like metal-dependent hydrolase (beta-lactamase superfamily II)
LGETPAEKLAAVFQASPVVSPVGNFKQGLDLFQDRSFYLLDAPGHYPGHLNALARIGPNRFILLAADCCHNRQCYNPGTRLISSMNHEEIEVARSTIEQVKAMNKLPNVIVMTAHETEIPEEAPLFPKTLNEWAIIQMNEKEKTTA